MGVAGSRLCLVDFFKFFQVGGGAGYVFIDETLKACI